MESAFLRPCSAPPLALDAQDLLHRNPTTRFASTVCCSSRKQSYIPKLEPFNQTRLERAMKDPPLIEKTEKQLTDYCLTLEGDECYSCWQAYFELKDLKKELPKADTERMILESADFESLIGRLHGIATILKVKNNKLNLATHAKSDEGQKHYNELNLAMHAKSDEGQKHYNELNLAMHAKSDEGQRRCPIPDGLPKTAEELLEEEQARMPDSPYTRLLRSKGKFPAWYTPAPDHQTD